ncbi:metallophosphoesterase [Labrys miyagiensis]|uniref:Metallophosphoesterase n=1 Tax=Labrys miyagiensis TaxID=346912 RepID=A0ABQ6CF52_9HYPH|nr:DNA repair exonuclease [Labrys miyagiensis]GLS17470.1 metallophosphoesterase [Labrys miyagiensis]
MRFRFVHAADLHLDSPMHGLTARQPHLAALFGEAARGAFVALIDEVLAREAAFLIISGDVYDGDWRDYHTGLFFVGQLARLSRAGIPTFLIQGNHDAESQISRKVTLPPLVHLFGTRKAETLELADLKVALHGRSFADRSVSDNIVRAYPAAREGWFNIGLLHTSLDGRAGHASYAPCTLADLRAKYYDYWALGHIHAAETVSSDPYVVFPGNLQGRHVREAGAKGAMLVEVDKGAVVSATPLVLDKARWAHARMDVGGATDLAEVLALVEPALRTELAAAEERPLALRLTLQGETRAHDALAADSQHLQAEIQAAADRVSDRLYIERVELATLPPRTAGDGEAVGLADPQALLAGLEEEAEFSEHLNVVIEEILAKLPDEIRQAVSGDGEGIETALVAEARSVALARLRHGGGDAA